MQPNMYKQQFAKVNIFLVANLIKQNYDAVLEARKKT